MRFGVCAGMAAAPLLAEAGYDYLELSVAGDLIPEGDAADWTEKRQAIEAMPIRAEAFNSFVRTGKIVGPEADVDRLKRYVETALARAAQVGGSIIVFGSGGARQIPEGFPRETALQQIAAFLNLCADASERTGVTVVIEPLCREECNVINLVGEGAEIARRIERPGVRNLADTFHMEKEGEPLSAIVDSGDVLAHAHTADTGRLAPGTGTYDHVALFEALGRAGYEARLSIECDWGTTFDTQIGPSLRHLQAAYRQAATNLRQASV